MTSSYPAPPPVPSSELRPGRVWYVVAAAIVAIGVCVGAGVFGFGMYSFIGDLPTMEQEFDAGSATDAELSKGRKSAIYVAIPDGMGSGTRLQLAAQCTGSGDGEITLTKRSADISIGSGGQEWQLVYDVRVDRTGTYRLECTLDDGSGEGRFAVGEAIDMGTFGKLFGSIGALVGAPCLALLVGGVIALIAAVRRSSHKKRLLQQRL